jgi:hypothetical protein
MNVQRIAFALLAGLLACGLPLWPIPYREVSMPGNPSPVIWLLLGSAAGLFAGLLIRRGFLIPVLAIAGGFVLAVLVRVGWETAADPTTHNLWPFEVVIAGFFGLVAGLIGVALARGVQRVRHAPWRRDSRRSAG